PFSSGSFFSLPTVTWLRPHLRAISRLLALGFSSIIRRAICSFCSFVSCLRARFTSSNCSEGLARALVLLWSIGNWCRATPTNSPPQPVLRWGLRNSFGEEHSHDCV